MNFGVFVNDANSRILQVSFNNTCSTAAFTHLSKARPDVEHLMLRRLMNCNELDLAPKRAPERQVRQMAPEHDGGGDLFAKVRLWYGEDDCRCQTRMILTSRTSLISRGGR